MTGNVETTIGLDLYGWLPFGRNGGNWRLSKTSDDPGMKTRDTLLFAHVKMSLARPKR